MSITRDVNRYFNKSIQVSTYSTRRCCHVRNHFSWGLCNQSKKIYSTNLFLQEPYSLAICTLHCVQISTNY